MQQTYNKFGLILNFGRSLADFIINFDCLIFRPNILFNFNILTRIPPDLKEIILMKNSRVIFVETDQLAPIMIVRNLFL